MTFEFRAMDAVTARAILAWRYAPPYDLYDADPEDVAALATLLDPVNGYRAVLSDGALAGFCCVGPDARVAGGDYTHEAIDLGAGLRPDLTGRGAGATFLGEVVAVAETLAGGIQLRATVAAFNDRALRACARVGFREVARFVRPGDGATFVTLVRTVPCGR